MKRMKAAEFPSAVCSTSLARKTVATAATASRYPAGPSKRGERDLQHASSKSGQISCRHGLITAAKTAISNRLFAI